MGSGAPHELGSGARPESRAQVCVRSERRDMYRPEGRGIAWGTQAGGRGIRRRGSLHPAPYREPQQQRTAVPEVKGDAGDYMKTLLKDRLTIGATVLLTVALLIT